MTENNYKYIVELFEYNGVNKCEIGSDNLQRCIIKKLSTDLIDEFYNYENSLIFETLEDAQKWLFNNYPKAVEFEDWGIIIESAPDDNEWLYKPDGKFVMNDSLSCSLFEENDYPPITASKLEVDKWCKNSAKNCEENNIICDEVSVKGYLVEQWQRDAESE